MEDRIRTDNCQLNARQLRICMLLPLRYKPDVLIYPSVRILGYLAHFSHHVTWVISSEKGHCPQDPIVAGVKVYAVPYSHDFPRQSLLATTVIQIYHILSRMRVIYHLLQRETYDLVLVRDNPFTLMDALIATYVIRRKYKIPFVFEMPNPLEQRWQYAKIQRNFFYYLIAVVSAYIVRHIACKADLILPISKKLKDHLAERGFPLSKMMVLPEGVDTDTFSSQDGKGLTEKLQLEDCQVIIYIGTMEKVRNLEVMIHAFYKLKQKSPKTRLLMVGDGDGRQELRKLAGILGLGDHVIFTGYVLHSEIPDFIAVANIAVSSIPPLPFYKFSSPIKLFEYMAMAKPVIANEEIPEHREVLQESGGGILVPFSQDAFANAVIELLDDPLRAAEMGQRGRAWVTANRSYRVLAKQLEKRLSELVICNRYKKL